MNLTPEVYAEIFRQSAFISALVAGFSSAFISVLVTSAPPKRIVGWTIACSIAATAGLLVCALGWTLSASRMAVLAAAQQPGTPFQLRDVYRGIHRSLSLTFIACFFLFFASLGLSGWIRSRAVGVVSTVIAIGAALFAYSILRSFIH
jgi:hypothetical protein